MTPAMATAIAPLSELTSQQASPLNEHRGRGRQVDSKVVRERRPQPMSQPSRDSSRCANHTGPRNRDPHPVPNRWRQRVLDGFDSLRGIWAGCRDPSPVPNRAQQLDPGPGNRNNLETADQNHNHQRHNQEELDGHTAVVPFQNLPTTHPITLPNRLPKRPPPLPD